MVVYRLVNQRFTWLGGWIDVVVQKGQRTDCHGHELVVTLLVKRAAASYAD